MTTANPNPLDRIRSLAPADMTDDELGVAVLLEIGCKYVATREFADDGFVGHLSRADRHSFYPPLIHGPEFSPVWQDPNPAEYYDALLPIVREWVGSDIPGRGAPFVAALFSPEFGKKLDAAGWSFSVDDDAPDHDALMSGLRSMMAACSFLHATPRQLAEAFVTAAREVG